MAHQLSGNASSLPGSPVIPEGPIRSLSATAVGQYHYSGLHQQPGGDSIPTSDQAGEVSVAMGPSERYLIDSPAHTRCNQSSSRHGVQDNQRPYGLETQSCNLRQDQPHIWAPRGGSVCIQTDLLATSLFQLETRSTGRGNGCLSTEPGSPDRVCQPPLVPYRESSESSDGSESPGSPSGCSLERPAMVSGSLEHALGVSSTDSSTPQPGPESSGTGSTEVDPPASRRAYLREKFSDSSFSEEAADLLLPSWRTKSSQSYDSHFRKWISWCSARGSNPISGPVAEVVNFLAHLFKQGYQSHSLNAYRSAISSVHDRVDSVEVGKHPMVTRLLKGVFHARPPLPLYAATWNVQTVLEYMEGMGANSSLH